MLNFQYSKDLTNLNNNNSIFFISKTRELNNISLPVELNFDLKNKNFIKKLEINKRIKMDIFHKNKEFKLLFVLVDLKNSSIIEIGSMIHEFFNYKTEKIINFNFSNQLLNKNSHIISEILLGFEIKLYKYDKFLSKKQNLPKQIIINTKNRNIIKKINYNKNLLFSINITKDLVSDPANILNPITYTERIENFKIKGLKIKVLNLNDLKKIGMKSLIAVAQGSMHEPRVIIMELNVKKNSKPIVLAGKGVTFDTGGISLKPSTGMEEMITDMGGSAVVVGSMINAALNNIKKPIVGIVGLVENMPDANAQRPGDIVKSLSGQTIEVLNTDAEGRLVLADIITYSQNKYKPIQIIDFATLTGAIMIALGTHKAGLFSNNDKLASKLISSGEKVNEKLWRLPLGDEYNNEINSYRADMKNIGSSRFGGSIHAAEFIQRFIKNNTSWAHLDIAGVSWSMKAGQNNISNLHNPGATAFGIRLIDKFLQGK
tara:strand:+ start:686 stop:2146 length:1461 start_codon:yes stop_codon:yes gene_type:complete